MDGATAEAIVAGLKLYLAIGAVLSLPFAFLIAPRIDAGASGSSIAFRVLLLPGAALLWPLVLVRSIALLRSTRAAPAYRHPEHPEKTS